MKLLTPIALIATSLTLRAEAPESFQPLDLRVHGLPFAAQPLTLEVRGPAHAAIAVVVHVVPDVTPATETAEELRGFPGSRDASRESRFLAEHVGRRFVFRGELDADGAWSHALTAPQAGSRLVVRGLASDAESRVTEFEALELDLLAEYTARPGDVTIRALDLASASPWVELANTSPFELELQGSELTDDHGWRQGFEASLRLPAHATARIACDVALRASSAQLRLVGPSGAQLASLALTGPSSSGAGGHTSSTPCVPGVGDVPDLDYEDSNCDGIDGEISRAVFVSTSGSATNPGTMFAPLSDLDLALALAAIDPSKDQVYVSEGSYSGLVTLQDGVSIYGGYSEANGWQRSSAYLTEFIGGGIVSGGRVGVLGSGLTSPVVLSSLSVETSTAPSNGHNYGVLLHDSALVTLEAVTIVAGSGGTASNGVAGAGGSDGSHSGNQSGGAGANAGGAGGAGGVLFGGSDGAKGKGPAGGNGGAGGTFIGGDGSNGANGGAGGVGAGGVAASNVGSVVNGLWLSNGDAGTGVTGGHGSGGGGGGGGAADFSWQGQAGGGGGGGGFGGAGGTGGRAGGSSFALFLANSNAELDGCQLTAGLGRKGGNGGSGGLGGDGGAGTNFVAGSAGDGGTGGSGGKGGKGGVGGGGGGGHSYAIVVEAASALTLVNSTLATSMPGVGGSGTNPGQPGSAALIKQL